MNKKALMQKGAGSSRATSTRNLVLCGLLVATSVILARFLGFIAFGGAVRISFSGIPIALAGALMGPVWGGLVGAVADLLGATLFPQGAFFPGFTLTSTLIGVIPGLILYGRKHSVKMLVISCATTAVLCSLILNTFWLTILLQKGFWVLLPTRIASSISIAVIEVFILNLLLKTLHARVMQ